MRIPHMMKVCKHLAAMTPTRNDGFKLGHGVALVKGTSANPKGGRAEEPGHENPYESYPGNRECLCCAAR